MYLYHKDGHRIPVSVRVTPMTDEEGNIIGKVGLFSDIRKDSGSTFRGVPNRVPITLQKEFMHLRHLGSPAGHP